MIKKLLETQSATMSLAIINRFKINQGHRASCTKMWQCKNTTTPQPFYGPFFPGPPAWAGDRRELLDFTVQGRINRGRHTDYPAGRHSIRTNQCPVTSTQMTNNAPHHQQLPTAQAGGWSAMASSADAIWWQLGEAVTALAHQQSCSMLGLVSTGMGDRLWTGEAPWYATSHQGQLGLLPSVEREMITGQSAAMLCGGQ